MGEVSDIMHHRTILPVPAKWFWIPMEEVVKNSGGNENE
jgi:hypothetical protein